MNYTATIVLESLHDESVLNFADAVSREVADLVDALPDQSQQVTVVTLTVRDEMAPAIADELSRALKSPHWYADVCHEFDCYIVFPGKVFHYAPKEVDKRQKAFEYAKSLGIPESQIAF